jgi:hypothetical protein
MFEAGNRSVKDVNDKSRPSGHDHSAKGYYDQSQ